MLVVESVSRMGLMSDEWDVVHATPSRTDKHGRPVDGHFDTVLVETSDEAEYSGVNGMCSSQLLDMNWTQFSY